MHYLDLRVYLQHGFRLIDVQRVLGFRPPASSQHIPRRTRRYTDCDEPLRDGVVKADEQLDISEDVREREEADRHQAHHSEQKCKKLVAKLLPGLQTLRQTADWARGEKDQDTHQLALLRRLQRLGVVETPDVQVRRDTF